jgi:regulator of replication initiation timing
MPESKKTDKELLLEEIKTLITDSTKENVNKVDLDKTIKELNDKIATLASKDIDSIKDGVDNLITEQAKLAAEIKALNEKPNKQEPEKPKSFKDELIAAVMEKAKTNKDLMKEVNDENGKRFSLKEFFSESRMRQESFVVKTEMLESSIVQNYVSTLRLTELDPQRVGIPLTLYPHVTDWMPSKTITRPNMALLVVYSYSDGTAVKTEGSASTISSFLLKTVSFQSFYLATYFTLSDETLDDLPEAMEEISITAPSKIYDAIDTAILGTTGDDSSAIKALFSASGTYKFTAFASGTTYIASTTNANKIDVLSKMKLQCMASKYRPDTVIINPSDIESLAAEKDQLDNSKFDRRVIYNVLGEPASICGLRIVLSTAITADTIGVLDSKQLMIGKRKDLTMVMGYNGTDLTEGQQTVVLKVRLAFGVRDPLAVIYCSGLAAAVAVITTT